MQIIIVGDGKVGLTLTQMLAAEEHSITVVDQNLKVLQKMQEECDALAVQGHGASRTVLQQAGAESADLLIAATSSDEVNLLSCLIAKKLGCKQTIARVRNPEYAEDLPLLRGEMGLTFSINPEEACAREIFGLLQFPSFIERERFVKGKVEIVRFKVTADSPIAGAPLNRLTQFTRVRVLVCAVDRDGTLYIPDGSFVLREGDDIFVTAASTDLSLLVKNLGLSNRKVTQVTLVGGSRIALYLANMLLKSRVGVKIIERSPERCVELSHLLPEADIVQGDGTEGELLQAEGAQRADALVSLTNIDEENIVLSMFARHMGVPVTVTKCSRTQYADMFRLLGIDTVVSPKLIISDEIVRYVRAMESSTGGAMITMHKIAGGKAEALEFLADGTFPRAGASLSDLGLKPGVLIASVTRDGRTIIAAGDTRILTGDIVVVAAASGHRIYTLADILA